MDAIKIEQAKSDYQKIVSFIEDGSPLPPETDPYWEACAALDRLGGFIADIEGAKNTEQRAKFWHILQEERVKVSANASGRKMFPITIHFNNGHQHLTVDAAKELSEKLVEAIEWVKPEGTKNTEQASQTAYGDYTDTN